MAKHLRKEVQIFPVLGLCGLKIDNNLRSRTATPKMACAKFRPERVVSGRGFVTPKQVRKTPRYIHQSDSSLRGLVRAQVTAWL